MKRFLYDNGLSLVLFVLFFFTFLVGQSVTGHLHYNNEQQEHGQPTVGYIASLTKLSSGNRMQGRSTYSLVTSNALTTIFSC